MTKRTILLPALALALAATPVAIATAGEGAPTAQAAATKTVTLKNISINPAKVSVTKGSTVKWVWRDGSIRHDVTWKSGGFKASKLQAKGTYSLTFKKKGTYRYFCSVHSGDMKGTITVK